jgi:hypothetical protein
VVTVGSVSSTSFDLLASNGFPNNGVPLLEGADPKGEVGTGIVLDVAPPLLPAIGAPNMPVALLEAALLEGADAKSEVGRGEVLDGCPLLLPVIGASNIPVDFLEADNILNCPVDSEGGK